MWVEHTRPIFGNTHPYSIFMSADPASHDCTVGYDGVLSLYTYDYGMQTRLLYNILRNMMIAHTYIAAELPMILVSPLY